MDCTKLTGGGWAEMDDQLINLINKAKAISAELLELNLKVHLYNSVIL